MFPFWSPSEKELAAVTWEESNMKKHDTYCCHVCLQWSSTFMTLFTKGDRLETKGLLKWEVLSWIAGVTVKYIESDSGSLQKWDQWQLSIADTMHMFIEEASGNRSSTACPGQRKACLCSAQETDHQIVVLWRYDLCTAAKGMEAWYYEKQLSLSASYFQKTKMTENAQQICCSQLFQLFFTPLPNNTCLIPFTWRHPNTLSKSVAI